MFLDLSVEEASKRGNFGQERYEMKEIQERVYNQFKKLQDPDWKIIDATLNLDDLGARVRSFAFPSLLFSFDF